MLPGSLKIGSIIKLIGLQNYPQINKINTQIHFNISQSYFDGIVNECNQSSEKIRNAVIRDSLLLVGQMIRISAIV